MQTRETGRPTDGERFVMVKNDSASGRINLVLNWFEELKRLAPSR